MGASNTQSIQHQTAFCGNQQPVTVKIKPVFLLLKKKIKPFFLLLKKKNQTSLQQQNTEKREIKAKKRDRYVHPLNLRLEVGIMSTSSMTPWSTIQNNACISVPQPPIWRIKKTNKSCL